MGTVTRMTRGLTVVAMVALLATFAPAPAADANTPSPQQSVMVGSNGMNNTPKLSCTLDTLTVTTRAGNPYRHTIWSRVYYRDANQQTWYINRGWAYTSRAYDLHGPLGAWFNINGFHDGSRWVALPSRAHTRDQLSYFGGTEFTFMKPGGYGSESIVWVLDYHWRNNRWETEWVSVGRC